MNMSDRVSTAASYAVSAGSFGLGALTLSEWLMIVGTILALATFAVNTHYKRKEDRRKDEYHRHLMAKKQ